MTVTLVAHPDGSPAPYVDVYADGFPAGAESLTVWRTVEGRQFKVRGLVDVDAAAGAVTILDFEAPFDLPASYRVEFKDALGALLEYSAPAVVTLSMPASAPAYAAWFHNPLDPASSVRVELRGQNNRQLTRPVDYEVFRVPGRSVGVAIFGGSRRGYERLVLDCVTMTAEDEGRFDALFGGYDDFTIPIVCVRAHPVTRLPATLFALVGAPSKVPLDGVDMGGQLWWGLEGDEVAPPPEAFVTALLDYAAFTAFYSSYAEFTASYVDYTTASRDYTIAGTE